jgi:NAD(P)-dependent dehydrogenase (short-subunit alcohol dehydrogenase family)
LAFKFEGKLAVVTGGSTGMGLATAKRFVDEGMEHVFITGRRREQLDEAVAEIGKDVTAIQGDVSNLADLDRLYDAVRNRKRKIDVLFANAGIAQIAHFETVDEKFFDSHFDVNVKGIFFTVQKALPLLITAHRSFSPAPLLRSRDFRISVSIALPRRPSAHLPAPGSTNSAGAAFA